MRRRRPKCLTRIRMTDRLHLQEKYRGVLDSLLRANLPGVKVWAHVSRVNSGNHDLTTALWYSWTATVTNAGLSSSGRKRSARVPDFNRGERKMVRTCRWLQELPSRSSKRGSSKTGRPCAAHPRVSTNTPGRLAYRNPDAILGGTWEAFERVLRRREYHKQELAKVRAALKSANTLARLAIAPMASRCFPTPSSRF